MVVLALSCGDAAHDDAVEALGPERRGVRPGPNHRPGQPCVTCHNERGPGSPEFSMAGTIYVARGVREPLAGVTVVLQDATGSTKTAVSNEVGNFYVAKSTWSPTFPVNVRLKDVRADQNDEMPMITRIGREGSCATCHYGEDGDGTHMPPVFLRQKAF
jgi:hypothetical protein